MTTRSSAVLSLAILAVSSSIYAQEKAKDPSRPIDTNQIPEKFTAPKQTAFEAPKVAFDYEKRVVMIPMRDGVKLYTVIVIPKAAKDAPMLLTRTCYNCCRSRACRSCAFGEFGSRFARGRPAHAGCHTPGLTAHGR